MAHGSNAVGVCRGLRDPDLIRATRVVHAGRVGRRSGRPTIGACPVAGGDRRRTRCSPPSCRSGTGNCRSWPGAGRNRPTSGGGRCPAGCAPRLAYAARHGSTAAAMASASSAPTSRARAGPAGRYWSAFLASPPWRDDGAFSGAGWRRRGVLQLDMEGAGGWSNVRLLSRLQG